MRNMKLFLDEVSTSSVVVLDCTEISPSRKLNLAELYCMSVSVISFTIGLIGRVTTQGSSSMPRANGVVVRQY